MKVIGITGSMAMGKSTLVKLLKRTGNYPVWDADLEVRALYRNSIVLSKIQKLQADLIVDNQVNKAALTMFLIKKESHLAQLEDILYPELAKSRHLFIEKNQRAGKKVIFLDIPLLFEKNLESICDYVILVSCPDWLQEKRINQRENVSKELIHLLKQQQLPDMVKRKKADFIVQTGLNRRYTLEQVQLILKVIKNNGT